MNVGLIIYGSLETVSGGYLYDRMLVKHLRSQGHTVAIFSLPWRNYPAHLTDNAHAAWARPIMSADLDILLQDELNHPSLFLANRTYLSRLGCPTVTVVHHLRTQEDHPPLWRSLYRQVEHSYLETVDGCVYNSRTTQHTVESLLGRALPGIVAYPAGDHLESPDRAVVLQRLAARATSTAPLHVMFLGNVIPRKGLHTLIAALADLPRGSWRLTIVGAAFIDERYTTRIREQTARHAIGDCVTWAGRLDEASLRALLARSDVLAVPSYEGFGIVYLEAMAYGLPVIATTDGAAREIVTSGASGFLISPGDSLQLAEYLSRLAENRTLLAAMGYQARIRYEQHPTWADSTAHAISWLESIARENRRRP